MTDKNVKIDWVIHGVYDPDGEEGIVYHTHGMDKYGSLELELKLPLVQEQANSFLNTVGIEIAHGVTFKDGDVKYGIFNLPVAFKEVTGIYGEGKRNLRVIFPDVNGLFPWDAGCEEVYVNQYR